MTSSLDDTSQFSRCPHRHYLSHVLCLALRLSRDWGPESPSAGGSGDRLPASAARRGVGGGLLSYAPSRRQAARSLLTDPPRALQTTRYQTSRPAQRRAPRPEGQARRRGTGGVHGDSRDVGGRSPRGAGPGWGPAALRPASLPELFRARRVRGLNIILRGPKRRPRRMKGATQSP